MREFTPDVIMMWTHYQSRFVIPKYFNRPSIPSVILEVDYRRVKDKGWYARHGFKLMLVRGIWESTVIPSVYFPFSVNEEDIEESKLYKTKVNKITFVGQTWTDSNRGVKTYASRRQAGENLAKAGLFKYQGKVGRKPYVRAITRYDGALACAASYRHSPVAKCFEIMGYGTALLCNQIDLADRLFDNYYYKYKDDASDVVQVAHDLLNNHDKRNHYIKKAKEIILERHTHTKRIDDMIQIFNAFKTGQPLPRKWGR